MRIKRKEKTVTVFTIKLTAAELKGLHSDVYDALNVMAGSAPDLTAFYDALRAEVHGL